MTKRQIAFVLITMFSIFNPTFNLCPNNCAQCSNTYLCNQCETGYYLTNIDIENSCQPCPFNCAICNINTSNNIVCSQCAQNSQMNSFGVCITCDPKCGKCEELPQNCTECSDDYQLLNTTGYHCIQKFFYGLHNCKNYDFVSQSSPITCNQCQIGFYNFRKDCDKCFFPCQSCSFDHQNIWNNQVLSFWVDTKQRLIQKIMSLTQTRLLQVQRPIDPIHNNSEENEYGPDNYTETYSLWNITTWNTTAWTSEPLTDYSGMDRSRLKGWMEAYFLFQAISEVINVNMNLIDVIYRCLPLMQQLLALTNAKSGQWNHIARHISNVTNKNLNPRMFQNLVVQKSATKTKCLSCQMGYYLIQSNGTCQKCPINCQKCSSSNTCMKCESGFFLLSASQCSQCSQNCLECSNNAGNCTLCSSSLYLVDSNCVSCDRRCHGCLSNSTSTCIQCKFPYSLMPSLSGACYRCSQLSCERCLQLNVSKCLQCTSGYFNNHGTCMQCNVQNCNSCYSGQCIVCNIGYQLSGGMCKKCGQGCLKCSQYNMTKCVKCQLGRYFQPLDSSCKLCPKYCITCNSSQSCLVYKQGFVLFKNRVQKCHIGCKICSSSNPIVCLECQSRYYLDQGVCRLCSLNCSSCSVNNSCLPCKNTDRLCQNCMGNCLTCESNNSNCLSCKSGYLLLDKSCDKQCGDGCSECINSLNNNIKCIKCKPNFALNQQSGICVNCLENCYGICDPTNINHCIKCSIGFQLVDSTYCKKCNTGCIQCQNGDCSTCQNGYKLTQTQNGAIVCSKLCKFPCQVCRQQLCMSCAIGYTLNNLTSTCVADLSCNPNCQLCVEGTYKNVNNTCVLCPTNCAKCVQTSCFICHEGFYLSSNGLCIQCQEPCDMCYTATKCKSCKDGYVLQILSLENLISTNKQLLFGYRCIKCSDNCKTCSFLPDLCLRCYPGMILRGNRCVGKYGIKFDIFLNKNFIQFLQNSQITRIISSLSQQLSLNQNNISIATLSQSSTRVKGYISCSSLADSTLKKTVLQNMALVGGMQIIDSNFKILINNYESQSDDETQKKNRKIISNQEWNKIGMWIGIGTGAIAVTVIGVLICCLCSRKKKVQNINSIKSEVEIEKPDKYEMITGVASDNINIE